MLGTLVLSVIVLSVIRLINVMKNVSMLQGTLVLSVIVLSVIKLINVTKNVVAHFFPSKVFCCHFVLLDCRYLSLSNLSLFNLSHKLEALK